MKINIIFIITFCLYATVGFNQIRIDNIGDVGIGTTNPITKFHLVDGSSRLHIQKSTWNANQNVTDITTGTNGTIRLGSMNTGSNSGNVNRATLYLFPNTGAPGSQWNAKTILQCGNTSGGQIQLRVGGSTKWTLNNTGNIAIGYGTATNTNKLAVNGSACKSVGGSAWTVCSDMRTKKNVKKYEKGLEEILQMEPIRYQYNGKGGTIDGLKSVSISAQKLRELDADMVTEFEHNFSVKETPEGDLPKLSDYKTEKFLSINTNNLQWMLVNGIQELNSKVEERDDLILELKSQLNAMEEKLNSLLESSSKTVNLEGFGATLEQNSPNPFNEITYINYTIPSGVQSASMQINDINGQVLKTVSLDLVENGELKINARELNAGSYSYSLILDGKLIDTKKMVLTK